MFLPIIQCAAVVVPLAGDGARAAGKDKCKKQPLV
jgi:hypothetical protein